MTIKINNKKKKSNDYIKRKTIIIYKNLFKINYKLMLEQYNTTQQHHYYYHHHHPHHDQQQQNYSTKIKVKSFKIQKKLKQNVKNYVQRKKPPIMTI